MPSCTECSSGIIDEQSLVCSPESPAHTTFRARLEGTAETNSSSLISLIEEWVSGGSNISVNGASLKVDSDCQVAISSFDDGKCEQPTTESNNPGSSTDNSAAIIGAVVTVIVTILIIAITVAIVVIAAVLYRHRKLSLK